MATNFMDEVLAGRTALNEVDDWVDQWHDDETIKCGLRAHLGLEQAEYEEWTAKGNSSLPRDCSHSPQGLNARL